MTDLQASLYQQIFECSDDAIITKTMAGIVTSWNPAAERIFGYRACEVIGQPMVMFFPPERLDEEPQILARIARGERIDHFETVRVRRDGQRIDISATISPIVDADGRVVGVSKIARDITERIQAERTIWLQANYDNLTHLPNQRLFKERLRQELARAARSGRRLAVMFIDLDHFKEVNDSLGHESGDALLAQAAQRMKSAVREVDTVARSGGDEFTVMLPDIDATDVAASVARRLSEILCAPFTLAGTQVHISGSIGVSVFPDDSVNEDELLKHADLAMYESKRLGRNQTHFFAQAMDSRLRKRLKVGTDLRQAIARNEFRLVYQPVMSLRDGSVDKVEALLRWQHPTHGNISPASFIPVAEQTGLIHEIGDWVFAEAARQALNWRTRLGQRIQVSINVSPLQLHRGPEAFERWHAELQRMGLAGDSIVLEITEGVMVDNAEHVAAQVAAISHTGMLLAIDDFGTGYSSLSYLSRLDIDFLKIDQSFVRTIGDGERELALVEAITVMAHKLGLQVIAEGVETAAQLALLRQIGCDCAQGYLFSKPVPAADIDDIVVKGAVERLQLSAHGQSVANDLDVAR